MRKLKLQMQISVDGFVAGPNGEEDWVIRGDDKHWQLINDLADSSDTILIGRKMAEKFIPHFENFAKENPKFEFAQKMVNTPKVIFSKTLVAPFGSNTTLASGDLTNEISQLKNQAGKDILVYGGAGFVSSLLAGGHIDEMYLLVNPILIAKGMRIFDLLKNRQTLTLVSATPSYTGVTAMHYRFG
ncbi:dihydrofolate reductase family protein [Flectobacillus roseus]|uniref:dihydrofolate reductase family protein n=1 Tax=Flectobacillus roseus TaxID=502259 RepID=UPI0024B7DE6B|nr:dihydrofolate reductase family protein [Flectobacillus roseus]MDI9872144.1 dihydrofolate reductase family protein [Flectobacillus roseus]